MKPSDYEILLSTINTGAAVVGAAATVIAAIVAIVAIVAAKRDSRDRSRPAMVAELQKEPFASSTVNLVLRNTGGSPARSVRVTFPDQAGVAIDTLPASNVWHWILARYQDPIDMWGPGQVLSNTVKFGPEGSSAPFTVEVSYNGTGDKRARRKPRYTDSFALDPKTISSGTEAGPSDDTSAGETYWRSWTKRGVRAVEIIARSIYRGS